MIWSNLYKIAPEEGNPNPNERCLQDPIAVELVKIELVKLELEEIKPKYCIVLSGGGFWKPFHKELNLVQLKGELPSEVLHFGQYKQTRIIVTKRARIGNSELFAKQIL